MDPLNKAAAQVAAVIPEPIEGNESMGPLHATGKLAQRARQRVTEALKKKGYSQDEIDGAISEAEEDRPLLNLFMTYIFPILLMLLENLILAKRNG